MPSLAFLINKRFEHQILALMLASLHLALWWDFGGALSRSLILAHTTIFSATCPGGAFTSSTRPQKTAVITASTEKPSSLPRK